MPYNPYSHPLPPTADDEVRGALKRARNEYDFDCILERFRARGDWFCEDCEAWHDGPCTGCNSDFSGNR